MAKRSPKATRRTNRKSPKATRRTRKSKSPKRAGILARWQALLTRTGAAPKPQTRKRAVAVASKSKRTPGVARRTKRKPYSAAGLNSLIRSIERENRSRSSPKANRSSLSKQMNSLLSQY